MGRKAKGTENFFLHPNTLFRLNEFFLNVILQKKNFKEPLRGIMHAFVFYGFISYLPHTISQVIAGLFGWSLTNPYTFSLTALISPEFDALYESILNIFSIMVLVGLVYFAGRRWIFRAKGLDFKSIPSLIVIVMIKLLMVTTLLGAGVKAIPSSQYFSAHTDIIAQVIGNVLIFLGLEKGNADSFYLLMWWSHILSIFAFMIYVPTSKHAHLIYAPFNFFFKTDTPKGALYSINLEDENAIWGANKIQDFAWPNLLDALSCIECGRCQNVCPANRTGKVLNPKSIIVDLKHALLDKMPLVKEIQKHNRLKPEEMTAELDNADTNVITNYIAEESIWGCTTCYACVEACPVGNNQVDTIMEMRRHLVLAETSYPSQLNTAFKNMENNSNPWGVGAHTRADWAEGLGVKTLAEDAGGEILYWVGCAGSFDERNKKISRSFVKIMQKAGVDFRILGTEENCSGDSARRSGNEYLYQTLVQTNIENFTKYNIKKIVTACPHCFNTIKNEYPQFGGNYEVIHHSDYISNLIKENKIKLKNTDDKNISYHDSCYLGRYNDLYSQPREILKSIGASITEPIDNHTKSLCCGAGGAQMWMEEQNNDRVNFKRTDQLLATKATTVATACPFCITMLTDGLKAKDKSDEIKTKDIAEIIAESLRD